MRKIRVTAYASLLMCCGVAEVSAAEWTTSASVTPGVTYSDNVCLSADDEQSEWIGLVTPAATVSAAGSRANLDLVGSVEVNSLTNSKLRNLGCNGRGLGDREQFAPRLNANADAVLLDNWFFIDGNATINQNSVTPFASGGNDTLDRTGNTNTTYNYSVSPYLSRRFKDAAELNIRYTWDDQYNSTDLVGDSSEQSAGLLLQTVPGVSRFSSGVQGDYSKVSYSDTPGRPDDEDSELKSAQLNLGYQLTRAWQLNGFYGNEWNDFVSSRDDIDGTYWDVGVRWTPNARTTVEAGTGDRFFGNTPRFAITHRHKRSAFNASYEKTLTYDRNIRTLPDSPPLNPDFGTPPGVNPGQTNLSNSPILDERFTLGYTFQGIRSSLGISAFQSDQTKEGGAADTTFNDSEFTGISANFNRTLSPQLSMTLGANWNEQKPKGAEADILDKSETWIGSLGLQRQLSQKTSLGLTYEYTDRSSDNVFNEYTENRITLDLRVDL